MVQVATCPRCLRPVPADAPSGDCPACLLLLGLAGTPDGDRDRTVAVTVAAATVTLGKAPAPADWPAIPGYELVDVLGAGGGGTVYRARQLGAGGRDVAVKVLHGTGRVERERLAREVRSLGLLAHPNIVTVYEVGETADGPFFSMEYAAGGSLADRIKADPPAPAEAARLVAGVARAVAAAHALGIRHRDLKPSNVLLAADGTPKVADFGLAKFADGPAVAFSLEWITPTGAFLGTPAYMAPEQAGGWGDLVDERTDVYGLGAVLYHGLTGRPPFTGKSHAETAHNVLTSELPLPRSVNRVVPPDLEAVCLKCLARDRVARYRTAGEVADDLGRFLAGEPTVARPLTRLARVRRKVRRHRRVLAGTAGLALLVAGAVALGAKLRKHPDPAPDPERERAAELDRIRDELAAGKTVELIGETGPPRWYQWEAGATPFAESQYHDGTCSFTATVPARLLLLPADVVPPAYRLSAQVRHDGLGRGEDRVGVFVASRATPDDDGEIIHNTDLVFRDYVFPGSRPKEVPKPKHENYMVLEVSAARRRATQLDEGIGTPMVNCPLDTPALGLSRDWRTVVLEVRPTGIKAWQVDARAGWIAFGPTETTAAVLGRALEAIHRTNGLPPPQAASVTAGGLGLQVRSGQASFRQVTVTRLDD